MQWRVALTCVVVGMGWLNPASAGPNDVPRILCVGDSWAAFVQLFRCFDVALPDYPDMAGFGQRGERTSLVGVRASEFDSPAFLDAVRDELLSYPTIDIVHLSLGGNDFIMDSDWTPSMPPEQLQAFIDATNAHIESVMDFILAIRPNIRIGLCGYDFGNHNMGGATPAQMNAVWSQVEQTKIALVQSRPRAFYIHNLGLMQYYYGIPLAAPPVAPHTVPFPGGYAQDYLPFPGGNPNYNTPVQALMDRDIHLTMEGYDLLARRCIDEFYAAWLSWPVALEILPESATTFRVRFSAPVTGVDASDFAVSGAKAMEVVSVDGSGDTYTVSVALNGMPGPARLALLDDDSIVDGMGRTLGGPGAGNGGFDYNGPLVYADPAIAGPDDFEGAMSSLDRTFTPVAWMLGGQRFDPEHCDANGGSIQVSPPQIVGNGMADAAELDLVRACLTDPALDLSATGGVTHAIAEAAWQHNFAQMQLDLGGVTGRIATVIPGIDTMSAGYMTLGDPGSTLVPVLLFTAVSAFITLPPDVHIPSAANYTMLSAYFGPGGDADGDGFTNRQEYEYFMPLGGVDLYVMAALDPHMKPDEHCGNSTGGVFNEGSAFCLYVPDPADPDGGFEWLKDGVALNDDSVLSGSHARELRIRWLRRSDEGVYECVHDGGTQIFGPVAVGIHAMPAASAASLALCMLAAAAWGLRALRRVVDRA